MHIHAANPCSTTSQIIQMEVTEEAFDEMAFTLTFFGHLFEWMQVTFNTRCCIAIKLQEATSLGKSPYEMRRKTDGSWQQTAEEQDT